MMELHGTDIVEMSEKGKQATALFIIPNLDFVIITAGNEQGLGRMEANSSDRTVVLVKAINKGPNAIVP